MPSAVTASRPACSPDNAAVFTDKPRRGGRVALELELDLLGVRLDHCRAYHPQTCGKVERFHQTHKKWLAAQRRFTPDRGGFAPDAPNTAGTENTMKVDPYLRDTRVEPEERLGLALLIALLIALPLVYLLA